MSKGSLHITKWRRTMKARAVHLSGGACTRCGYDRCQAALEFHHRDPHQKEFSLSRSGQTWGFDRVMKELQKCDLLCANCHRELHYEETLGSLGPPVLWFAVPQPSREELLAAVTGSTTASVALAYKVGLSVVQRWCRNLQIPLTGLTSAVLPRKGRPRTEVWYSKELLGKVVWSAPMTELAPRLGVTDRAIAKRCKSLGIALPVVGHWLRCINSEIVNKPDLAVLDQLLGPRP